METLELRGRESNRFWNKQRQTGSNVSFELSAESSGSRGPGFESRHSDHKVTSSTVSVYRKVTEAADQLAEGTYILRALGLGDSSDPRVLHVAAGTSTLDQCKSSNASVASGTITNSCGDAHLFKFAKTGNGGWTIESVATPGTYLAVSGTSLSFGTTPTEFTITGQSGNFQIKSGENYFWFNTSLGNGIH